MNELTTTLLGNLTADPDLRFLGNGKPVVNVTIAHTTRTWSRDENKMVDGDTVFIRCSAWDNLAEHIAESLTKGTRVLALVDLSQRKFEKDGVERTVTEGKIQAIGPDLLFATARVSKAQAGSRPAAQPAADGENWQAPPSAPASDRPPF